MTWINKTNNCYFFLFRVQETIISKGNPKRDKKKGKDLQSKLLNLALYGEINGKLDP